jgi:hypothetical protein
MTHLPERNVPAELLARPRPRMPGDLMTRFRKLRHAIRRMTHQPLAVVERMISNSPCEEVGRPTLRTAPVEIMTTQEIKLADKLADRAEIRLADKAADKAEIRLADKLADKAEIKLADKLVDKAEIRLADKLVDKLADRAEGAWRGRRLTGTPDRPKEAERTAPNDEHATEHLRGRHLLWIDDPED